MHTFRGLSLSGELYQSDTDICHILDHLRITVFHLMVGSANIGFLAYFTSAPFAASHEWVCWSHGCGLFLMAFPQILLLAAFLLLLSFWVDFCHQYWDNDDSDEEKGMCECLLEREASQGRCCPFLMCSTDVRRRQKIVISVTSVAFLLMISFATMIWTGKGKNYIDSLLAHTIYLKSISAAALILAGALAGYGGVLLSKMKNARSEGISSEMLKVKSLAAIAFLCFSTSSVLAIVTNIPLQIIYTSHSVGGNARMTSVLLFLYYLIGWSVPSALVLWLTREIPILDAEPLN